MVVLPLVPVTPTTSSASDGWPSSAAATGAIATRSVRDHDLRHTDGKRTLVEQRDRAALDRVGSEVVSVDQEPAHAAEQRAGCDRAGVVHDRGDVDTREVTDRGGDRQAPRLVEEPREIHRATEWSTTVTRTTTVTWSAQARARRRRCLRASEPCPRRRRESRRSRPPERGRGGDPQLADREVRELARTPVRTRRSRRSMSTARR